MANISAMSAAGSAVSASSSASKKSTSRPIAYTVKKGDTVTSIAKKYGMSVNEFMAWTGLKKTSLSIGQEIPLPHAVIKSGGINAFAQAHGMTPEDFCALNHIPKNYAPKKGEVFYIKKSKKVSSSSSSSSSTTASTSSSSESEDGKKKIKLGNGKSMTAAELQEDAIESGKKDPGFSKVKDPYIVRPMPFVNSSGKIEAASELHLPTNKKGALKGKVVILNAGHGGYNPANGFFDAGTVLSVKNAQGKEMPIEEWRVADSYIQDLTAKLQAKGATVVVVSGPVQKGTGGMFDTAYLENMLRGNRGSSDIKKLFKNTSRSNMAFVSIHVESAKEKPSVKACTVRANNDAGDKKLAEKIQTHIGNNISILTPRVETNNYYVTRAMGKDIPAVLVELGNIANKDIAASLLSSGDRNKYTTALATALEETLLKK